jgi:ATP-dependent exoDNAse (exonuclease V) beta subunit
MTDAKGAKGARQFPDFLLLEASAGSGKTYALSRRFAEYLLAGDVPDNGLSNMLAITFTRNAAREMNQRIIAWLKDLALGTDPDKTEEMSGRLGLEPQELSRRARAMVERLLEHYSDFQVQTIDSFTQRLAKASARELGFRPDFEVSTSYGELLDLALALMAARIGEGRDRELTSAMDDFLAQLNGGGRYPWNPQEPMRKWFQQFLAVEAKESGQLDFPDVGGEIDLCLAELQEVYDRVEQLGIEHGLQMGARERLPEQVRERQIDAIIKRQSFHDNHTPLVKGKAKGRDEEAYLRSKSLWGQTREIVARLSAARAVDKCSPFGLPYRHFRKSLDVAKQRQGKHHIDDICRVLSGFLDREVIPEIYLKLGARIRHYMVDEFQDTDPAQWRSLQPLLEEALASGGSAFLVGDIKQAIYMFRKADYRTMRQIKREILGQEERRMVPDSVAGRARIDRLPHNHRSGQVIVDYVSQAFNIRLKDLMGSGAYSPDQTGLTGVDQQALPSQAGRGYVEVRHIAARPEQGEADAAGELRGALVEIVQGALERGFRPQDIAVLAAANQELDLALDWLTQAGVPATSSSGQDVRDRKVVAEIISLLAWLDSPVDNLAWAEVLLGQVLEQAARADGLAWSGDRARQLLQSAAALGPGAFYARCREEADFLPLWERYFGRLYRLAGYWPAYDLACLAMELLGVFRNFPQEAGSLVRLLEAANLREGEAGASLRGFLTACREGEQEVFSMELPDNLPAVRIMTYYKAKGLGFPVVVNIFRQGGGKTAKEYFSSRNGRIVMHSINTQMVERTAGTPWDLGPLKEEFDRKFEAQELNCLYVACTRAEAELYNLVVLKSPGQEDPYAR